MADTVEQQLLERWRDILRRNREVLAIWTASDYRLCVNGIDMTDAEIAAARARIAHLEIMVRAIEAQIAEG